MINQAYRLHSPKQFRVVQVDEKIGSNDVIVKPTYLSICAADLRYYSGKRSLEVLKKKLPMSLIHEAVGVVLYDPKGVIKKGTKVVMIPNTPVEEDEVIKENYLRSSKFRSSGFDGFMQEVVSIERNRIIPYEGIDDKIAVLSEIMSVAMNALEHFQQYSHKRKQTLGIWGCGSVGYCMALVLKYTYPDAKIVVFDANSDRLNYMPFADEAYLVDSLPNGIKIDHAFECVGGQASEYAINQMIDIINPQGSISLLGVSENNVPINTRMVLEKGLTLLGNSRSSYEDFDNSLKFVKKYPNAKEHLSRIISEEVIVNEIKDMSNAFEEAITNDYKTIMKWEI